MILADTSIWIRHFKRNSPLRLGTEELQEIVICPVILQEIFQGLRTTSEGRRVREELLYLPRIADPTPLSLYLHAADIFSLGRAKGFSIRSSIDCLIAAIAIENDLVVWHHDRDFAAIAKFTALETLTR